MKTNKKELLYNFALYYDDWCNDFSDDRDIDELINSFLNPLNYENK